jgi:thiamine-phosphate pyrophosphorylase
MSVMNIMNSMNSMNNRNLTEAASRIRQSLGHWPQNLAPWHIHVTPPGEPNGDDLIIVTDYVPQPAQLARWVTRGAAVLIIETKPARSQATLHHGGARYALEGELSGDWLAAFAAFLDCGFAPHDALVLAFAWRDDDEARPDAWPVNLAHFPSIPELPHPSHAAGLPDVPAQPFAPCPMQLGLYPVLPSAAWVERALDCGVKTVQLRSKQPSSAALQCEIERCVKAGQQHNARVFINDHWREALAAGAYGVHLGQEDLHEADLAAIASAGMRLGLSTHGYYEMLVALHFRPSYIALGAVFPTTTKTMPTAPQGLARLACYVQLLDGVVPLVAIGGIDAAALPAVLATGVGSAAVVRALTQAADPALAIAALQREFNCFCATPRP